ncbi:MAG: hypothetical protein ACRDTF_21525 [Pseudonocardiaceae bacterium]
MTFPELTSDAPRYPCTPYLWNSGPISREDRVLAPAEISDWLQQPVVVEEKLDGVNVSIWWDQHQLRVASRGGPDAMDRGAGSSEPRTRARRAAATFAGVLGSEAALVRLMGLSRFGSEPMEGVGPAPARRGALQGAAARFRTGQ